MKTPKIHNRYRILVHLATIAAIASLIVVTGILFSFFRRVPDPFSDPSLIALKESLRADPSDESIKVAIRDLDASLRADFFRRREFTRWGSLLLLGAVGVIMLSLRATSVVRRRLPNPRADLDDEDDPDAIRSVQSLTAVGGLVAGILILCGVWITSQDSALPRNRTELAALYPHTEISGANGRSESLDDIKIAEPAPVLPSAEEYAANWPRFRGPKGSGIAGDDFSSFGNDADGLKWDAAGGEGILWKTQIELPGKNSPILWDDALFFSGADESNHAVYCVDAASGQLRWTTEIPASQTSDEPLRVNDDTGYAAPTMATDGIRVYAMFAVGQLVALDMNGEQLWTRPLGPLDNPYGHASSLITHGDRLIVQLDQGAKTDDLSRLYALDGASGETVWSADRETPASWATPLLIEHEGNPQIITCSDPWVVAYGAEDGKEIWRSQSLRQDVGPSPVPGDGLVVVANESPGAAAIRLGGTGDVTETHVLWTAEYTIPDTASPLLVGDLVLMLTSYGTLACYKMNDDEEPLWEEDFDDIFQASPTLIGDHVLLIGESGQCWMIRVTAEACETISQSDLGESCVASPIPHRGRIYIRGEENLFCVGMP